MHNFSGFFWPRWQAKCNRCEAKYFEYTEEKDKAWKITTQMNSNRNLHAKLREEHDSYWRFPWRDCRSKRRIQMELLDAEQRELESAQTSERKIAKLKATVSECIRDGYLKPVIVMADDTSGTDDTQSQATAPGSR